MPVMMEFEARLAVRFCQFTVASFTLNVRNRELDFEQKNKPGLAGLCSRLAILALPTSLDVEAFTQVMSLWSVVFRLVVRQRFFNPRYMLFSSCSLMVQGVIQAPSSSTP